LEIKPTNASKNLNSPTCPNTVGVRFGVREMKLFKQMFAYETTMRTNLQIIPENKGTRILSTTPQVVVL